MKKTIVRVAVAGAVLLVVLGIALFLCLNPHYIYMLGEQLGIGCDRIEMNAVTPEGVEAFTAYELSCDARVTFDQSLMLVNAEHPTPDSFEADISEYKDSSVPMNDCIQAAYEALAEAVANKTGERLLISSSYRTRDEQSELYLSDPDTANAPGSSEHETGLALDVYVKFYASYGFLKTEAGRFVNSECSEYGFIIRYPIFGQAKTGMKYEPWHIRYVGEPHARIIYNGHITLEEYISSLEPGAWYEAEEYLISRQMPRDDGELLLPTEFERAVISPDNTGGYIITLEL